MFYRYPDHSRAVIIVGIEKRIKDCLSVYWLWWTEHDHGIYKPQRLSYQTNGHYLTLIDREIVSIITWLIQTFTTSITINIYTILSSWWKTFKNNFVEQTKKYCLCWSVDRDPVSCLILLLSRDMSCLAGNEISLNTLQHNIRKARKSFVYLMFVGDLPQKKRLNVRFECFVWLLRRNMIKHPDTNGVWLIELQFFLRNKIIKQLLGKIYQKCSRNIVLVLLAAGCC